MEMDFRSRNNDMGPVFPTFQERVNSMLPASNMTSEPAAQPASTRGILAESAAPVLEMKNPGTPHMLNQQEMQRVLDWVEQEAEEYNQELIRAHSGLNEQRVEHLLDLLE